MITVKNNFSSRLDANATINLQGSTPTTPTRTFWGRLWRGAVKLAIGFIPGDFAEEVLKVLNISLERTGDFSGLDIDGNVILTDIEVASIESWFANVFSPKYKLMVEKGNQIFSTTDINLQVRLINELNNELAILKAYLDYDNPKYSVEGLKQRNEFAYELIGQIEHLIFKAIEQSPVEYIAENVTISSTPTLLYPIFSITQFKGVATNYTLGATLPVDTIPVDLDTDFVNETTTSNTTETKKAGFSLWWLVAGFVGYKILK